MLAWQLNRSCRLNRWPARARALTRNKKTRKRNLCSRVSQDNASLKRAALKLIELLLPLLIGRQALTSGLGLGGHLARAKTRWSARDNLSDSLQEEFVARLKVCRLVRFGERAGERASELARGRAEPSSVACLRPSRKCWSGAGQASLVCLFYCATTTAELRATSTRHRLCANRMEAVCSS